MLNYDRRPSCKNKKVEEENDSYLEFISPECIEFTGSKRKISYRK